MQAITGLGVVSVLMTLATVGNVNNTMAEWEGVRGRMAGEQAVEATQALKRYIQDQHDAVLAAMGGGAMRIDAGGLVGTYLPPGWRPVNMLGQEVVLAVVPANDGEPLGYVYTRGGAGTGMTAARAVINRTLTEGSSPKEGVKARFAGATTLGSGGLPATDEGSLVVSTAQLRTAATRALVSRFREPDEPEATVLDNEMGMGGGAVTQATKVTATGVAVTGQMKAGAVVSGGRTTTNEIAGHVTAAYHVKPGGQDTGAGQTTDNFWTLGADGAIGSPNITSPNANSPN